MIIEIKQLQTLFEKRFKKLLLHFAFFYKNFLTKSFHSTAIFQDHNRQQKMIKFPSISSISINKRMIKFFHTDFPQRKKVIEKKNIRK